MDSIEKAVLQLRGVIKQERSRKLGEENTKRFLITRLLEALNWDIYDLGEVKYEYRAKSQDNPVDYAMFLHRSTPCLFLEAKALDFTLDDRKWIGQTISYASIAGVDWCVLTNGDEYRIYNAHASMDAERKLFRKVTISDENAHNFTVETLALISKDQMQDKQIDLLWKTHLVDQRIKFVDQRIKGVLKELLEGDEAFIQWLHERESHLLLNEIGQSLQRANVKIDFPALTHTPEVESHQVNIKQQPEEQREAKQPRNYNRNYNKYLFYGDKYNKRRLVLAVISRWAEDNKPESIYDISQAFPMEISPPLFVREKEAKEKTSGKQDRYFLGDNEVLEFLDSSRYAISNQWTKEKLDQFIGQAKKLGYEIEPLKSSATTA